VILSYALWWLTVAMKYRTYLKTKSYPRGANVTQGQTTNLKCELGNEICVYRATQICTDPGKNNFENPETDPISSGLNDSGEKYGEFNPLTTIDLTKNLSKTCNGSENCSFKFTPNQNLKCNGEYQLISTYSCIPKNSDCESS